MVLVDVPLHITSIWAPRYAEDPLRTGSLGCGVVVRPGVLLQARPGRGRPSARHVEAVLTRMGVEAEVSYTAPVDLGVGYGLSAALALGTALGAAALAGRPLIEAAKIAHLVEVELGTGLGDVIAEYYGGGIELRIEAGAPGVGIVDKIPYPRDLAVVASDLGRYPTYKMLDELRGRLATIGERYIGELLREPTYERFAALSREFSREIGFLRSELEGKIKPCARYADTYYVKKKVLVFLTYRDEAVPLADCLKEIGLSPRMFEISDAGARVAVGRAARP